MQPKVWRFSRILPFIINRYTLFLALLLGYTEIMQEHGGLPSFLGAWRLEIPLIVYLYYYFNRILRPSRLQALLAAVPILFFYVGFDVYFILLGRLPHIAEASELPEMFHILPPMLAGLILAAVGLPLLGFVATINYRRPRPLLVGALPLLALILPAELTPDLFMDIFQKTQGEVLFYSEAHSTRTNGRIGMTLYNEARRKSFLRKTAIFRDNPTYRRNFTAAVAAVKEQKIKRNVHMLVLESFFDPTLFKGAHYSKSPVAPEFAKLFQNKAGFSISPVFGGSTAQAEFEVLCGVPALRELSGVEFDVFTGAKTYCLPNLLTQGGYETEATNPYLPDFYNSTKAYSSLGFSKTYYAQEYAKGLDTYFSHGELENEMYIFDGTLLSQNLDFITKKIKDHPERPIFNYVLTMYGHLPHNMNAAKRPHVIDVTGKIKDEQLERAVNQYYYRTQAIAEFVNGLIKVDPQSLIVLVSDHLPPLTYGPNTYRDLDYLTDDQDAIHMNRVYVIENGKAIHYNTIHHYDIPRIVLNYLTKGEYCQEHACNFKANKIHELDVAASRDEYMSIMAQAMGCDSEAPAPAENEANEQTPAPAVLPPSPATPHAAPPAPTAAGA